MLSALLVGGLLAGPPGPAAGLLSHPGPAFLGRISYSLYLWHYPFFLAFGKRDDLSLAVELLLEAITQAGYRPGTDISLCLDPASSELWEKGQGGQPGQYRLFKSTKQTFTSAQFNDLWVSW